MLEMIVKRSAVGLVGLAATLVVRKALQMSWRTATANDPPEGARAQEASMKEKLLWTAISAAAIAATQFLVHDKMDRSLAA